MLPQQTSSTMDMTDSSSQPQQNGVDRSYYIQYYTQKLLNMASERQTKCLAQLEQLFHYHPNMVESLLELIQAFFPNSNNTTSATSSGLVDPSIKCLKSILTVLTAIQLLIQSSNNNPQDIPMLGNDTALYQYFLTNGCKTNSDVLQWLGTIREALANSTTNDQTKQATEWFQVLEKYFATDVCFYPELTEDYVHSFVRPSTSSLSEPQQDNSQYNNDRKAFIFIMYEFVDSIHTILKVRK